ncbi:UDP-GlcNAc:betaGal beta-1,3-N-acetylglucosaminyltransferase 8-like [Haemaphysalis longicornis]
MLVSFLTVLTPSLLVIQLTRASVPQHFPTHLCQRQANQPAIEVVLAVKTSPANFAERQAIRHSMASPPALAVLPWRVVFYMGYARDMANVRSLVSTSRRRSRFLRWEVSNKGDLIIAPHEDHAQNTVKVLMHTIRWVHERCEPELRYFVHTNDSTMVDLVAAHEFLRNVTEGARCFYCAPVSNVPVDRNVSSPTYVSKTLFPDQYFPTFCEGDAIIVPAKKLRPLVLASEAIAQFPLLGPYITGHLPVLAGIVHNDLSAKVRPVGAIVA